MILRKPYAFFIKHFKLMHMILAILVCYSLFKTKELLDFFNEYSAIVINVKGQDLVTPLLPFIFQITPILIIIVSSIILFVMIVKKKPYIFYIVLIIIYIFSIVLLQISKNILIELSINIIDPRNILLVRDLILICFVVQLIELVFILVRATGFDVKKFDFDRDLKAIQIDETDREEVEIQVNFDSNKLIRNIRKYIRYLKYAYKEHKKIANIIIASTVSIFSIILIVIVINSNVTIEQNVPFVGNNFTISVMDSYLTNTDYRGNNISNENYYLILKIKIKNNTNQKNKLDIATAKILIDNYVYTPTTEYKDSFIDFGYVYQGEEIKQEYEEKLLVYQIPKELKNKKMIFSFADKNIMDSEGNFKNIKIKIKYKELIGIDSDQIVNLNETLDLKDSILNNTKIKISAFDIQKKYKISYNYCINKDCFESIEYLIPIINSNYNKVILKINGNLESSTKLNGIYDLYDFIEKFGKLNYVIDGKEKIQRIDFKEVKSKRTDQKNNYYIEVLEEVINAEKISFDFTIRNKNYKYILK